MAVSVPHDAVVVPDSVLVLAGGDRVRAVWRNGRGGLTFALGAPGHSRYVKWALHGSGLDLSAEAVRLDWARSFDVPVPEVLGVGADTEGSWLVSAAMAGESAVSTRWQLDPRAAATAVGHGLRLLHDKLPVNGCSFTWAVEDRLTRALSGDRAEPTNWHPDHASINPEEARAMLAATPPVDRLVVCHGDPCAPNTLLDPAGHFLGLVDLGGLGVADRWADLAVATWSLEWNFGPGHDDALLEAYGVAPDPQRTAYYRLLWDLTP